MGPRKGRTEIIMQDPRYEFIAGILEPEKYERSREEDLVKGTNADTTLPADDKKSDLSNNGHVSENNPESTSEEILFTEGMNPKAFPKSMGLAFVLSSSNSTFHLCATWARYKQVSEKPAETWQRVPDYLVVRDCKLREGGQHYPDATKGIELLVSCEKLKDAKWYVAVFLKNTTPVRKKKKLSTEDLVFQPQIRVVIDDKRTMVPLPEVWELDEDTPIVEAAEDNDISLKEEKALSQLYRDRSAFARGFNCSAMWSEIDPEHDNEKFTKYENAPFGWIDYKTVDSANAKEFGFADLRTEFFPVYSVISSQHNKILPEFDAKILSEITDPSTLVGRLSEIPMKYEQWITEQFQDIISGTDTIDYADVYKKNLEDCKTAKNRIQKGIEILASNEKARLAFCFMNRAMNLQSEWTPGRGALKWKPFQIAFILLSIEGIVDRRSENRKTLDLLWFPTGGGKTEAYLGTAIFTMAYRRLTSDSIFDGVSVLSRYTLRLLTIQQFRRALKAVTACEYLRTIGWYPPNKVVKDAWGIERFSIGLYVGQSVTPNNTIDVEYRDMYRRISKVPGAISVLKEPTNTSPDIGDPAQVLNCPACNDILAFAPETPYGKRTVHWLYHSSSKSQVPPFRESERNIVIDVIPSRPSKDGYATAQVTIDSSRSVTRSDIIRCWNTIAARLHADELCCSNPVYPGYFFVKDDLFGKDIDFEIRCPNPKCKLNVKDGSSEPIVWQEQIPGAPKSVYRAISKPFRHNDKHHSLGIPIPAYTVDDQVYHKCPSFIISTVDKIARLPFEPKAASIFGNVNRFDSVFGYFREGIGNEPNSGELKLTNTVAVEPFLPPDLIIQDELHLIEGPIGSMVGLYEGAIDILSAHNDGHAKENFPKYIASTATIREAQSQVMAVYNRHLLQFPPNGKLASDNFFAITPEKHARDDKDPGRLYMGICTPGTSAQTALKMIWAVTLQTTKDIGHTYGDEVDKFRTVVGYFNAIRELSAVVGLYRQDIPEWMETHRIAAARELDIHVELSSRLDSRELPAILDQLEVGGTGAIPAVFATSMFGTGVDIKRLGAMIVHGQPKTTAHYIQSTGRIGRTSGGLIITFYRAVRPRDLDHYEFFVRYHRALQRYVEPISVCPFSSRAMERALGPIAVAVLRNSHHVMGIPTSPGWSIEARRGKHGKSNPTSGCRDMKDRRRFPEIKALLDYFEQRAQKQPSGRNPGRQTCFKMFDSEIDKWKALASKYPKELLYWESPYLYFPKHNVILGDMQHQKRRDLEVAYENAPQSLRDIEATGRFNG
jgi:hypothetical protein